MQVSISDTCFQKKGPFKVTMYTLVVMPGNYIIGKHYDEFIQFRKLIVAKNVPGVTVPLLPKKQFFNRFDPNLIEYRKNEFQKFLDFVVTHPVFYDDLLKEWLGLVSTAVDPVQVVVDKLSQMVTRETDPSFIEQKAKSLCDKDVMKKMYLEFDWETTKRLYEDVKNSLIPIDSSMENGGNLSSGASGANTIIPLSRPEPVVATTSTQNDRASTNEREMDGKTATTSTAINPIAAIFLSPAASIMCAGEQNISAPENTPKGAEPRRRINITATGDTVVDDSIPEYDEADATFLGNYNPVLDKKSKQKLRIKLVITEITSRNSTKSLRRILCPIMDTIGPYIDKTLPRFGMFHSALIIGPWYIEWNASELCVPRKIMSRAAILSCDLDGIIVEKERIEQLRENLAQVICHWNATKRYKNDPKNRTLEGNCQDFVDDVLAHLGIDSSSIFNGPLGDFLKEMRTKGVCEMAFKMTPEFREEFSIREASVTFESHLELDQFVHEMLQKNRDFRRKYSQEWMLLKSFDRAFWLRHLREKENEKYKPMNTTDANSETGCPFDNPITTSSFAIDRI